VKSKDSARMKDIAQFPARESAVIGTLHLTRESALLLKDLLAKAAMPLTAARHLLPVMDQVDKVVSSLSPDSSNG
jgi:hypothetical protein